MLSKIFFPLDNSFFSYRKFFVDSGKDINPVILSCFGGKKKKSSLPHYKKTNIKKILRKKYAKLRAKEHKENPSLASL